MWRRRLRELGKMALPSWTCDAHILSAVLYWPLRMNAPVMQVVLLQCNDCFHDFKKKIVLLLLFKSIHLGHTVFVHWLRTTGQVKPHMNIRLLRNYVYFLKIFFFVETNQPIVMSSLYEVRWGFYSLALIVDISLHLDKCFFGVFFFS